MRGRWGFWVAVAIFAAGSARAQEPWGTVRTTGHEAGAPDSAGNVPLRWRGDVVAPRAASDSVRVLLILKDEAGEEVYACASAAVGPTAGGAQDSEIRCLVPARVWPRVYSMLPVVVGTGQPLVVRPKPETAPARPPPAPEPPRREVDPRLLGLQREADDARDKLAAEDRSVADLQEEYNSKSEDYIDQCSGDAAKADSGRCQRLRDQLEKLRKDIDRAQDKRDRARKNYERAADRLREAQ